MRPDQPAREGRAAIFYTTVRSPSAILVGAFFTLVTAYVLLEDVFRHGAPLTNKHVMTLVVLAGTVYFGHRLHIELRAWRLGWAQAGAAKWFDVPLRTYQEWEQDRRGPVQSGPIKKLMAQAPVKTKQP